jgi:hypothetical protein
MHIKINVKAQINIDIGLLLNFQGDFKKLSEENHMKLRNEIIEDGFNFAPHVWKCDKHYYILDGHQRIYVMNQLLKAGYLFEHSDGEQGSMIPCNLVVADTISSAKRKVLQASSQYGKIDMKGFEDFVMDVDFEFDNFDLAGFEIPDLDFDSKPYVSNQSDDGKEFTPNLPDENGSTPSEKDLQLIVKFESEEDQESLFIELRDRGYKVKV